MVYTSHNDMIDSTFAFLTGFSWQ